MIGKDVLVRVACSDIKDRFWKKVTKSDGCWVWSAGKNKKGYGRFNCEGSVQLAHRVSWIIEHVKNPGELCVLHRCDNPSCVRPDHLFLGTRKENNEDMRAKGRRAPGWATAVKGMRNGSHTHPETKPRGEGHVLAKLTTSDVFAIRQSTASPTLLSRKFGVSRTHINRIINRESWTHIQECQS